ncbi:tetratricopeptide repeat protein [Flavobacterium paronense]|uniref:Tetratricopeptide repeat protein n=1 Tax=Flavobacterium paronense TaxID=1392775 RepID=A0ABV5GF06_9FLAO|nr:tetratricopeptide repeat protein [Flavobacterium paronense]MDN3678510.1 tetratricopeptide repeat protein [Flavobacterium paronense]
MKNIFYIFLLIFQISLAQTGFDQGNKFYEKENWIAAISSYESVVNSGKQSAELYFNLGNCYYKSHKVAPAIFNFEKALLLSPNDTEIKTNLEFARKMAIDDIKVIPKVGFNKLLADLTSKYYYDTWAWIAVAFAFLFLLFFVGYYFSHSTVLKRIFFFGMFLWLIGIGLSAASGFYEKGRMDNERPAIVFAETASVKSEPKSAATDAFVLHEGTKVYILESIANWKKVELTDETTGWIEESTIKEIKN